MHPWLYSLLALSSLLFSLSTITTALAVDITKPSILGPITKGPNLKAAGTTTPTPYGGMEAKGWVMLAAPASADVYVGLYLSNAQLVEYPFSSGAKVSAGQTVGNFTFRAKPVTAPTPLVVTARIGQQQESKTINYTVLPPVLLTMSLNATSVLGGGAVQGTATFSGPPASAGSMWAKLSSNNPAAATIPAKAMLEVGHTVAPFEVKTLGVSNDTPVTISASTGSTYPTTAASNPKATLTVLLPAVKDVIGSAAVGNFSGGGCIDACSVGVTLTGPAGPEGALIQLKSGNQSVAPLPPSATVPAQQDRVSVSFTVVPHPVTSRTSVGLSATYRGVKKTGSMYLNPLVKPDLVIKGVSLQDRFGNPITRPLDAQPFKLCVKVAVTPDAGQDWPTYPSYAPPPSSLRVTYAGPPSGAGTSVSRTFDITVIFGGPGSMPSIVTPCPELPGLQVGQYYDVTLQADLKNQVDERNEGNNSYGPVRISR